MLWYNWVILVTRLMQIIAEEAFLQVLFDVRPACPDCCYGNPLSIYSNVSSAIVCGELCTRHPACQSWMYNLDNETCRTNAETLNKVNTVCSKRMRYGEKQKDDVQTYKFNPCNLTIDCQHQENRICRRGRCECANGYRYDPSTNTCPRRCMTYGKTAHEVDYNMNTDSLRVDATFYDLPIHQCAKQCYRNIKKFTCVHFEHRTVDGECQLFATIAVTSYRRSNWTSWIRDCA